MAATHMHLPQGTPIERYFSEGRCDARSWCEQYHAADVLSGNLEDLAEIKRGIIACHNSNPRSTRKKGSTQTSRDNADGQKIFNVTNLFGKILAHWNDKPDGVTQEQHDSLIAALRSRDALEKLKQTYVDEGNRLRAGKQVERKSGQSSFREKHYDWKELCEREANHTRDTIELLLIPDLSKDQKIKLRNAIMLATLTRMENTRSAFATIKVRNFDIANDNYISFSDEEYGDTIIVWNVRKGGAGENRKRYHQIVPKDLSDLLKRYVTQCHHKYYMDQEFLLPIDVSPVWTKDSARLKKAKGDIKTPGEIMDARQKSFTEIIGKLNEKLLGLAVGESDMRRIQITHLGMPDATADLERLALKFHHTGKEHRDYFRNAHNKGKKRAAETQPDVDGSTSKQPRVEINLLEDSE
ncbi:hypothetical protein HDV00_008955 [Rhizophlyctis rosea]|nr:hypothetical protein HDV00_008955 [Rhizophlyctis rosea]